MAVADMSFLLAKLNMEDFGRILGIEAELQELRAAIRSAARTPNWSSVFRDLIILNHRTNELLDQIRCWYERHGDTSSSRNRARTGEDLMKVITFFIIKRRFRRAIVPELQKVVNEYQARTPWADSHHRHEDQINLFMKRVTDPNLTDEGNLIDRDRDVDNILAVMCSISRDILNDYRRRDIRRRLFKSRNNDDKRELKDLITRRWRQTEGAVAASHEWRFLNIIPIVGTLGIGKTAVARMVFHHASDLFDERIWVYVSPLFDRARVLREFAYRNQQQQEEAEEHNVMTFLKSRMREKRFLLVLDDFWNEDPKEWDLLMWQLLHVAAATGKLGNVVIITTRTRVGVNMNYDCYELQALSADDSRRLLSRSLDMSYVNMPSFAEYDHGHDDEHLGNVAKILLERCSGVPLAIEALAKYIISCKSREQDLDPNFRFTSTSNSELLESFRLSYELLFPVYWRNFLQFCCLFPEDHIFDMEEFNDIWVAASHALQSEDSDGYLPSRRRTLISLDNLWKECFKKLEASSSSGKVTYKLCPLMRDLSLHVSGQLLKLGMSQESIQHLPLLVNSGTSALPRPEDLPKALTTLILVREAQMVPSVQRCKISVIPKDSLARLSHLRVLDLQCTMIKKLPRAIGQLLNLAYLNLSETDIKYLPRSIGDLHSLRFLKLNNCKYLRKLNGAVTNLVKLRKLELSGCPFLLEVPESMENMKWIECLNIKECPSLDRMPRCHDSGLLRTLPRFIQGDGSGNNISKLLFRELEGELRLENLEKLKLEYLENLKWEDPEALLRFMKLKSLTLEWKWNHAETGKGTEGTQEAVINKICPTEKLIKLEIISYAGERFPDWIKSGSHLISLEEIRLFNLKGCQTLPTLGKLPRLRIAEISGMDSVTEVDEEFYGAPGGITFPCLQKLTFSQMLKLKKWLDVNDRRNVFPCLTNLTVINCPQLMALEMKLPSVTELTLWLNNEGLYTSKDGLKGLAATVKKLSISLCEKKLESSECEGFFKDLGALEELEISGCRELTNLPEVVKHLKSIKSLTITSCDKLEDLSKWLEDELPSLHSLSVSGCHLLRAIPDGLRQRPGLNIWLEGHSTRGAAEISDSQSNSKTSSNFRGKEVFQTDAGCVEHGSAESPITKLSSIDGIVDALLADAASAEPDIGRYSRWDLEF